MNTRLILGLLFATSFYLFGAIDLKNVVIETKSKAIEKLSKNELKEQIGSLLKQVMDDAALLVGNYGALLSAAGEKKKVEVSLSNIGKNLSQLSNLQKRLSSAAGNLVENKKPFKDAYRKNLRAAKEVLEEASKILALHGAQCKKSLSGTVDFTKISENQKNELSHLSSRFAAIELLA